MPLLARAEVAEVVKVWDKIASLDRFETEEEDEETEESSADDVVKAAGRGCQSFPCASVPHHPRAWNPRSGLTNPILIRLNKRIKIWD